MKNKQKTITGIVGVLITVLLYFSFDENIFKNLMVILLTLSLLYAMILIGKISN
ncbi:hypothetical protein GCM10009431_07920 [Gaetbulibacter jejuensis]|uniref:Uncharacterized protein n=1 Tax=Gaetbulibacter jejuensis TaxID=584607 RepID=A0ABN1JGX8_9FLAO